MTVDGKKGRGMAKREEAKSDLVWYFRKVFQSSGLEWTQDNESEVRGIVDLIIQAAIEP